MADFFLKDLYKRQIQGSRRPGETLLGPLIIQLRQMVIHDRLNPHDPEISTSLNLKNVSCVEWHPQTRSLLALGSVDGHLLLIDVDTQDKINIEVRNSFI